MARPPRAAPWNDRFADQAVRLRARARLSQRELAGLLAVSPATVRRWEAGQGCPTTAHLHALIALYMERGVLAPGKEEADTTVLWEVARRGASAGAARRHEVPPSAQAAGHLGAFYGRATEMATLTAWVHDAPTHLIAVLGQGGVGKTALAARLARELAPTLDAVYWRSLRNAPAVEEWLAGAIDRLSDQRRVPAPGVSARPALLRALLRERRALLVLDNLESVLEPGAAWPRYRTGYEGYGEVLQQLGEPGHRATLLVASRETLPELVPLSGPRYTWQILRLGGLGLAESRALLQPLRLAGTEADWAVLVAHYRGNALALRLVGHTIAMQFAGDIGAFLAAHVTPPEVGRLLAEQVDRLSPLERSALQQLAIAREPVRYTALAHGPVREGGRPVLGAIDRLWGRSLLEAGKQGGTITLQPVVLEYATAQLVAAVSAEVVRGQPMLLVQHLLVQDMAPEHVRRSQEQLIAAPLLEALVGTLGGAHAVERQLLELLDAWQGRRPEEQGHGPGNALTLLRLLRGQSR